MSLSEALQFVATVVAETVKHPHETSVVERRGDQVVVTKRTPPPSQPAPRPGSSK
jgi:hypothetical protein